MGNYEKMYKEALERAKYLKENTDSVGAKDISYNFEYIFPELKESEDERIRKMLIKLVKKHLVNHERCMAESWLEKQGEPKLSEDLGEYITELSKQFPEVSFAKLSRIAVRVKNWLEKQCEQKPAWSEEDENMRQDIISGLKAQIQSIYAYDEQGKAQMNNRIDWLKSIKPNHWKPSEEQMEAIKYFIDFHRPQANASIEGWKEFKHLESLYNNLKNFES